MYKRDYVWLNYANNLITQLNAQINPFIRSLNSKTFQKLNLVL